MRVLHVSPYSGDAWAYGGIPRVVEALTDGLAARGHEVTVCTTDVCDGRARLAGRPRPFAPWSLRRPSGVHVRVFPNVSNHLAYHQQVYLPLGLRQFLGREAHRFDVGHLHACRNVPGVLAARALGRAGVPYVLAPNGTAPAIERRLAAKRVFDRLWGTRMLRAATRVIAVTAAEREDLRALGVDDGAIRDLPNPVEIPPGGAERQRGAFRAAYGLGHEPLVLFLGKLTPRKGVDVLVRALARLADPATVLVIAGNDMGSRRQVERLVSELGLGHRVRFVGLLVGDDRLGALADADLVVYPSQHEIFGLVPCEALGMGTPVVVSDDSGCGEILGGLPGVSAVPFGDVSRLASAIDSVLADPAQWRRRAAASGHAVRERFAPAAVCAGLERIYAELA